MRPELACAVLSCDEEPHLVEAVRSVFEQDVPVELVVVHSGSGDPASRLAAAGLDVPVHSYSHRRYPGAVRNLGIARTRAPYVAFLAADCLASPGWAAARLRHHAGAGAVASVLTNAYPDSASAWAALLLLHNRRLAVTRPRHRLLYSLSYKRELFDLFGTFREDIRAGEDTEFNARIRGTVTMVFATDVVTAHRYPTATRSMLHDAFRRGRLQACMQGSLEGRGPRSLRVAVRGPLAVLRSLDAAGRSAPDLRGKLLRSWPLVIAGGVAYTAGALTATAARQYD